MCHGQTPPFLSEELIFQILSRLPVRSLLEFKRVCKSWKILISDSKFAKSQLRVFTVNPSITHQHIFYFLNFSKQCKIVSFPLKPLLENPSKPTKLAEFCMENRFVILGSCNGLLCLFDIDEGYVQLWNPIIRLKSQKSPTLDSCGKSKLITCYGFGYDHINDKYKLVVVVPTIAYIYTFCGTSWKTIENFPSAIDSSNGKFVSGTLNWVIAKSGVSSNQDVILSFDLVKETYKEVLLPKHDGDEIRNATRLGVFGDCICACFHSNKINWDFWLMKKYGVVDSWTRLMTIPHERLFSVSYNWPSFIEPLFIFENGIVLQRTFDKLFLYNLNNGNLDDISDPDSWNDRYIYYESLVSPQM